MNLSMVVEMGTAQLRRPGWNTRPLHGQFGSRALDPEKVYEGEATKASPFAFVRMQNPDSGQCFSEVLTPVHGANIGLVLPRVRPGLTPPDRSLASPARSCCRISRSAYR